MAAKDNFFSPKKTLKIRGKVVEFSEPWVMGIINLTPDSFYDGGKLASEKLVMEKAKTFVNQGAKVLDLGACSTRPNATNIDEEEEKGRLLGSLRSIRKAFPEVIISVDTFRSEIARIAVDEGADMINDISGGCADEKMVETIAALHVPYILMHSRGNPQTMQLLTQYENLLLDIVRFLEVQIKKLNDAGHNDIVVDPGIGFAKTIDQNYEILKNLEYFKVLKHPLLVGVSRKSFIYKTLGIDPEDALNGTTVCNAVALVKNATILRVHDVKEAVETVELIKKFGN